MNATRTWKCADCGTTTAIDYDWLAANGGPICGKCDSDMELQPEAADDGRSADNDRNDNMRFDPWKCPTCGQPATGTVEVIHGVALLIFDDEGNADYAGETKVDWSQQTSLHDARGQITLECLNGHQWQAISC